MVQNFLALFYVDDDYIASQKKEQLQEALDILVGLFERAGLITNVGKTKAMTYIPGKTRTNLSDDIYAGQLVGLLKKEWNKRKVVCNQCGDTLKASSLTNHLEGVHGVYRSKVINKDLIVEDREPVHYVAETFTKGYCCLVEGCDYGLNNELIVTPYIDFEVASATNTSLTLFLSLVRVPTQDAIFATCRLLSGPLTLNGIKTLNNTSKGHKRKLQRKGTDTVLFHSTQSSLHTGKN